MSRQDENTRVKAPGFVVSVSGLLFVFDSRCIEVARFICWAWIVCHHPVRSIVGLAARRQRDRSRTHKTLGPPSHLLSANAVMEG